MENQDNKNLPLVMVVEDDLRQAEDFANIINDSGRFRAIVAHNGIEAFELLRKYRRFYGFAENEVKCILLDIRMPEMNGIQFIKLLREDEKFKGWQRNIPIVFLTAFEERKYWLSATDPELGLAAGYITKPLRDEAEVIHTLVRIVINGDTEILSDSLRDKCYNRLMELDN